MTLASFLGQQFGMFYSFLLVFLTVLFLQNSALASVLQDIWSDNSLDLGCFGPGSYRLVSEFSFFNNQLIFTLCALVFCLHGCL